jgi:hypothetical protein
VTAYYLAGTTGWEEFSTNTGISTELWNPQIQSTEANFGFQNNQFGFNITGPPNLPVIVETADNLTSSNWTPLQSFTLTNGSVYFSDPQSTNSPARFYRIGSQ